MQTLRPTQFQQLLNILTPHLNMAKAQIEPDASQDQASGTCLSISINPVLNSPKYWIMDFGATSYIYFDKSFFISLRPIQNTYITLPDHSWISVLYVGNVQFGQFIMFNDVFFVP